MSLLKLAPGPVLHTGCQLIKTVKSAYGVVANQAFVQFIYQADSHLLFCDADGTGGNFCAGFIAGLGFVPGDANTIATSDFLLF